MRKHDGVWRAAANIGNDILRGATRETRNTRMLSAVMDASPQSHAETERVMRDAAGRYYHNSQMVGLSIPLSLTNALASGLVPLQEHSLAQVTGDERDGPTLGSTRIEPFEE